MEVKKKKEIKKIEVNMPGAHLVKKQVLIGPEEHSDNIIMRCFSVAPGGYTPFHKHDFEHVVNVLKGQGVLVQENRDEIEIDKNCVAFVPANEKHQFLNTGKENLDFLCIITASK